MEENTVQTQPVQSAPQPVVDTAQASIPVSPMPINEPKKGGSGMWIIIIVLVVILLGAGGFYFYSNMNKAADTVETTTNQQTEQELNSLQNELNTTDPGNVDGDFTQVNKDLLTL